MKYFSCFSGIGGFELGIQYAYETIHNRPNILNMTEDIGKNMPDSQEREILTSNLGENEQMMCNANSGQVIQGTGNQEGGPEQCSDISPEGLTCVGFSEIDKYASQIYQSHFPNHKPYGDITKINTDELPDFDCLVGGFPCQAFSIAGKRRGFEDTRGTLFFELARILRAKQPRLFVFENVKGLLSHDNGKTFTTIIATIDELGYDCQWQVLNSKNHGVPQNRERVFIVGHLRGTSRPKVFPFGQGTHNSNEPAQEKPSISPPITTQGGKNCRGVFIQSNESSPQPEVNQSDNSNIIVRATYSDDMRIRRLTPTECERLQGFPDGWTEGVSDTQRYKCLGNAVTVNVIRDICISLFK